MFRSILKKLAALVPVTAFSIAQATGLSSEPTLTLQPGDLIVQQSKDGWKAIKVLAIDAWPNGDATAHCLIYNSAPGKPTSESLKQAGVRIWHAPIAANRFAHGWERIGTWPPSKGELAGFIEYLKLTDFPRYLDVTGQDSKAIVHKANEHYKCAIELGNQGRRVESIAEYSKAIELFPLFFEAIDNRAFTYMELGKNQEALQGFEESLRVNPNGLAAYFSKGECLMKLGRLEEAAKVFGAGVTKFPQKKALFEDFLKRAEALKKRT